LIAVLVVTSLATACGDDSPIAPSTTTPTTTTEVYSGSLAAGGSGFYSFSVTAAGPVSLTFASLSDATGRTLNTPLTMGMGVPAGEGCGVTTSVTVPPGLSAQLTNPVSSSIYCVQLSDAGGLTAAVTFGVRIVHP
jgi:hypothetical protein